MAVLTLYGSTVADAALTTACDLAPTTGGVETSKRTSIASNPVNNIAEVWSKGGSGQASVTSIPATPTGKGWVYAPGVGSFDAGNWSASFATDDSLNGPYSVTPTMRFFRYSGGVYTSIGNAVGSSQTLPASRGVLTVPATALGAMAFGAGDLLYIDLWYDHPGAINNGRLDIFVSTSAAAGVANDMAITTPNFSTAVALSAESDGQGTLAPTLSLSTGPQLTSTLAGVGTLSAMVSIPFQSVWVTLGSMLAFTIDGTLTINNSVGRRSAASFQVLTDTSVHFAQYQQVGIYNSLYALVFSGYVIDAPRHQPGFQNYLVHEVTCIDQHYLADKRVVAAVYRNKTCGFIVNDLIATILTQEGVTAAQVAVGATVPVANFGYCTVADALDALVAAASASGIPHYWQIDQNKQLWFVPYSAVVGPAVDGTTIDAGQRSGVIPSVKPGNVKYRNTQYAVGGVAQTPLNDETVQGDGQTRAFPFKYALASAPTLFQLNGVTKSLGTKGQTGYQYYWAQGDNVIAQDTGQTILVSTDRLHMQYIGQFSSVFTNNNAAQVAAQAKIDGTSGIVEAVLEDKTIASAGEGNSKVNQQLTQYGLPGERAQFATMDASFAPGQLITVTYAPLGLGAAPDPYIPRPFSGVLENMGIAGPGVPMLVEEVDISDQSDGFNLWYTVNGVVGPYDTTWVEFFGNIFNKPVSIANSISVGVTLNVPLAPSSTLAPSTTLAPG